nr:tetratricopeptide repeat protein [uncultured Arsenicibacter sp.]
MEISLIFLLYFFYLVIRYFTMDHDTPADKDRIRFEKGILLLQQREFEQGYEYFNQAVKQNPKSALAYAFRGKCQLANQNYYSAIYDLTQALNRDNTLADSYLDRGIAYYSVEQYQDAFREFDKAVWHFRGEQPDAYRWRAIARLQLSQHTQAESDLNRAVMLGDENSAYMLQQPPFVRGVVNQ